jgi:hypothetical protein
VPGLTPVGLPASRAAFFSEALAGALSRAGARVTTQKAIAEVLGLERQKQLLGCGESSCAIELANALGADAIVSGEVAALGESVQCNVKVVSSKNGETLESLQLRARTEEAMLDELEQAAARLAESAAVKLGRELSVKKSSGPSLRVLAIAPLVVGAGAAVAGAVLVAQARAKYDAIPVDGTTPISDGEAGVLANSGKTLQTAGWLCVGIGAAAMVAGVAMILLGSPPKVQASVAPTGSGGAAFVLGGVF